MANTHMELGEHILGMLQAADACPCEALPGNRLLRVLYFHKEQVCVTALNCQIGSHASMCSGQLLALSLARQASKQGSQEA